MMYSLLFPVRWSVKIADLVDLSCINVYYAYEYLQERLFIYGR